MSTGKAVGLSLLAIALIVAVSWGAWALTVGTSGVRGQGDAIIQKNSAQNWTQAQSDFEKLYANVEAADRKIVVAKEKYDANPDSTRAETEYFGVRTTCEQFVADYNAKARTYTAQEFRSADLPEQISNLNPNTDCKE